MRPTLHPQHLLTAVLLMLASLGLQANALDAIVALVNDDIYHPQRTRQQR